MAGTGAAEQVRISSATGAMPSTTWPVISRSPVCMLLRSRTSAGLSEGLEASRSIWDS